MANRPPSSYYDPRIPQINDDLESAKNTMIHNIHHLGENRETLQEIEFRTEKLKTDSELFRITSRKLKWKQWIQQHIPTLVCAGLITLVLIIIIIVAAESFKKN